MIGGFTEPYHRVVGLMAILQSVMIVFGTMLVGTVSKGVENGQMVSESDLNSAAVLVRKWGFVLLLLPALWAAMSLALARRFPSFWIKTIALLAGTALLVFGVQIFANLALNPTNL